MKKENNIRYDILQTAGMTIPGKFLIMKKKQNDTIEMLQYQLRRYKAMRKGAACQSLQYKLQKLMSQQANA